MNSSREVHDQITCRLPSPNHPVSSFCDNRLVTNLDSEAHPNPRLRAFRSGAAPGVGALAACGPGPSADASTAGASASDLLNDAPTSRFHRRAVLISGMGFFTDAYDLFVISTVATLVKAQWTLSTTMTSWVTGAAILGAFVGAFCFGRLADVFGRKTVYVTVAVVMIVGALLSAVAPSVGWLVLARLLLGLGIGGDYPVSAVLMSEYANRNDRGRLVGLVFSMQAVGLIVGPLIALALLSSGMSDDLVWRLLLGVGALPAAGVIYLRSRMPESPRFVQQVKGRAEQAARSLESFTKGEVAATGPVATTNGERVSFRSFLTNPTMLKLLVGTAGSWFLFDYAYYGNTLSLPVILGRVAPSGTVKMNLVWTLGIFIVFALPGYLVSVARMDRIGHRRLQFIGFSVMAACFLVLAAVPTLTSAIAPFLLLFGVSYFFVQFGPNTTTFVLPSEVFPVSQRTTGHGIAASIGKLGAFVGVFLVPRLETSVGLRGMLVVAGASAALGLLTTSVLPEPAKRTLEEMTASSLE